MLCKRGQLPYQKYVHFTNSPQDIILALAILFFDIFFKHLGSYKSFVCSARKNFILQISGNRQVTPLPSKFVMINELRKFETQRTAHKISER